MTLLLPGILLAAPVVSSFAPTSGVVGTSVTITGTGFTGVTGVRFNATNAVSFTVNSTTSITAVVPTGATSGRVRVLSSGGNGVSATNFTVLQPPTITTFTPATARVGQTVTVNGTRFAGITNVSLNGLTLAYTFVSTARITFVVPSGATSGFITITTPDGTATSATQFVVLPDAPTVTSFSPGSGAEGFTSVTITGTNFLDASEVRFATTSAAVYTVNSATSITATVPVGAITGRIRVVTPGGTGVSATNFRIVAAPTITSFAPAAGAIGSTVVIQGTNFVNVSGVSFNGTAASTFTVNGTATRITVTVPAGTTSGTISVTTPSGSFNSAGTFTVNAAAPTLLSFTPSSGVRPVGATLGTLVTVNGANYISGAGNTLVYFNSASGPIAGTNQAFVSATRVRARVPAGAISGPLTVTTANGSAVSSASFTVTLPNALPTITAVPAQRGCANSILAVNFTVGDAETASGDLVVTSSFSGSTVVIDPNAGGLGSERTAVIEAGDATFGGTSSVTLTVTDGAGQTASTTFNVVFDGSISVEAGSDQTLFANQPVSLSGFATGSPDLLWTTDGSGSFDNANAAVTNYNPSQADYLAGTVLLTLTGSPASGSQCAGASDAVLVSFVRPDIIVVGEQDLSGIYGNVLITGGGVANLVGALDISGSLSVQSGSSLVGGGSCQPITGSGSFELEAGATISICHPQGIAASGALGQIRTTGTRIFNAAANYTYAGTAGAQQSGTGVPMNLTGTLTVNNASGVDLTSNVGINRLLVLANGDLRLGDGNLTIASNATGTGMVVNTGGVVSGSATVQRYISPTFSTGLGYRHLSAPVVNTSFSDLATAGFTPVVNSAYNTAPNPLSVTPYPNIFGFDETRFPASADFTRGYFSPTSVVQPMVSGVGYSVYMTGASTPNFVGTLGNGTFTRTGLTRTGSFLAAGQKSGWHMLGNPYPSPIDWDLVTVPAGMSTAVSVFRSTGGSNGSYVTYTNGVGTPGTDLIGLGQGFFVRVTGSGPVDFTFTNACRLTSYANAAVYRTAQDIRPLVAMALRAATAPAAEAAEATVYFQDGASAGYDESFDGARPGRNIGVPTLASVVAGEELAVNGLPTTALEAGTTVSLLVDVPKAGTYVFEVGQLRHVNAPVYLTDAVTGTVQPLTADARYTFTTATAGEQVGRFALRFGAAPAATNATTLTLWPNPAQDRVQVTLSGTAKELTVFDAVGRVVRTLALAAGQTSASFDVRGLPAGVYSVRGGAAMARLVVE